MPPRSALRRLTAPSSCSASSLVAPQTESFWQAVSDSEIFSAPMGTAVDVVPEGTVVKEHARFVDPFNEKWIATADEEGHNMWLRELEELSLDGDEDDRDPEWVPAILEGQENEPREIAAPKKKMERQQVCAPLLTSDAPLFAYYWSSGIQTSKHRDWNAEYQSACERVLFGDTDTTPESGEDARLFLHRLIEEFASHIESGVTAIVTDMFGSKKQNPSGVVKHPTVAGAYYFEAALLKIAIDADGTLGGDEGAMKVFSHVFKNTQILSHSAPRFLLSVPLSLSMTFGGYRVFASSIPPFGVGVTAISAHEGTLLAEMIAGLASELNLKTVIKDGVVSLSPSFCIVPGLDCRLYTLGLADLMPPIAPPSQRSSYNPATTSRYWRIRPEAVEQSPVPLSPFAFGSSDEEDARANVLRATHWVRCVGLQTCAAVLGLMERCSIDIEPIKCSGCGKAVEDELRFGVCTQGCCYICAQCNINAYEVMVVKGDGNGCGDLLQSYVKCGSKANSIRSLRLSPDVTTILHHHGVNLRFLHAVYSLLPKSARGLMGHYLEIEMVARAAKCVFNRRLRRGTTSLQDIGTISAEFFMALMQPSGEVAEAFWAQELGPAIQELFDVFVPFDTEALDIARVCDRVSELTGVSLTEESIASFALLQTGVDESECTDGSTQHVPTPPRRGKGPTAQAKPSTKPQSSSAITATAPEQIDGRAFIQVSSINPTMKNLRVPTLASEVGARREYLNDRLSALLLLWAGEMDGKREQYMAHEASHPRYLLDKLPAA